MGIILLACEGRHELAILPRLAVTLGWDKRKGITGEDPESIQRLVPQPPRPSGRDFSWRVPPRPVFLQRGDDWMVVQRFDGDQKLRKEAPLYAQQIGLGLAAVGSSSMAMTRARSREHDNSRVHSNGGSRSSSVRGPSPAAVLGWGCG